MQAYLHVLPHSMKTNSDISAPSRPRGDVTVYAHKELFRRLRELLGKRKGTRGASTPSQFFEQMAIRLIREEGRKHGIKLPEDLASN